MTTNPESEKPTIEISEFYHIHEKGVFALILDSHGDTHFLVDIFPAAYLAMQKLSKMHGAFVNHKQFASMRGFQKFAKTHGYLCKYDFS